MSTAPDPPLVGDPPARARARGGRAAGQPAPTEGKRTTRRQPRYTLDELVDVAVKVFIQRGYEGASMEDLAREAGLTKSSFYHHVSGKEELLDRAASRALDALGRVLDEPEASSGRPVQRLEHVLRRTTDVLLAELPYVTLLLRVRGNTDKEREILERRRQIDAQVAALVREAADAGEIRSDIDPRLGTRLLFGMVNSITTWYRPGTSSLGWDEVQAGVVKLALDGLRARQQ